MTGILLFPAKPAKDYKFKKSPRKVLELTDEEAINFSHGNRETYEFFHYMDDLDKLDDKKAIEYFNKWSNGINLSNVKKSGNGYMSEDKKWIIRIFRCTEKWFDAVRR